MLSDWLRCQGIKIGTTTGYTAEMMAPVTASASEQGYMPDTVVTPSQVPAGRPAPYMMFKNALLLKVWPLSHFIKIGDTPSDIAEGQNAGCWTVGVAATGNATGLSLQEMDALTLAERKARLAKARAQLQSAGANYVIDSLANAAPVIEEIAGRIQSKEKAKSV